MQFDQYEEVENVYGLELSRPRRAFGETNLSIKYIDDPVELNASVDLLFSSHVIEHMSNPDNFKKCADIVLKPDGIFFLLAPTEAIAHGQLLTGASFGAKFILTLYLINTFVDFLIPIRGQSPEMKFFQ